MDTKKLRQKILDLAIHGKLVPQDPNDEPASVLLERIHAEKEALIKEGKIKRTKKTIASDTSHYENMPFDVPEGWCWIRLKDIASFGGGKTPSMENKEYWDNGTHLWVTSKDMKTSLINDSMMKISDEALKTMQVYQPGTLLMVTRSGILRRMLPLAILGEKATVNQDLKTISIVAPILPIYVFYAILANESMILRDYHKDGTTVDSINFDKFVEMPIPLPPQNEQKYKIRSITTQAHGQKSSSFFGASPPKNAKNLIKIARARTSAASVFGALPPRRGQEGQKGARRPSVSEHMHPLL